MKHFSTSHVPMRCRTAVSFNHRRLVPIAHSMNLMKRKEKSRHDLPNVVCKLSALWKVNTTPRCTLDQMYRTKRKDRYVWLPSPFSHSISCILETTEKCGSRCETNTHWEWMNPRAASLLIRRLSFGLRARLSRRSGFFLSLPIVLFGEGLVVVRRKSISSQTVYW